MNTNTMKLAVAAVATAAALAAYAERQVPVASVQKLVEAVTNAVDGDVIVISPGTYTFDGTYYSSVIEASGVSFKNFLDPTHMANGTSLVIMGADESHRTTWTAESEPVILKVDCSENARLFNFATNKANWNISIRNLTVTGSKSSNTNMYGHVARGNGVKDGVYTPKAVFTNCVFRGNTGSRTAIWLAWMRDCCWTNNASAFRGTAYNCDFIDNSNTATYTYAYDCRFVGNSGAISASTEVISNCLFESNSGYLNSDKDKTLIFDSMFTNNTYTSSTYGLINNPRLVKGCAFVDNTNTVGCVYYGTSVTGSVEGCSFLRNFGGGTSYPKYGSAGVYMARSSSGEPVLTVTNCTFEGNCVQNSPQNVASGAAVAASSNIPGENAYDYCAVADSSFVTNRACYRGAGVTGVHAVRCTFDRNLRVEAIDGFEKSDAQYHWGGDAKDSFLEDCDLSGGDIAGCVASRCTIHNVTNSGSDSIFREYTRATNCLVIGSSGQFLYRAYVTEDAEFVNCTFITNSMSTIFVYSTARTTNGVSFVNCLFHGNKNSTGDPDKTADTDLALLSNNAIVRWHFTNTVTFANCHYGVFTPISSGLTQQMFDTVTNAQDLALCVDPKFIGRNAKLAELHPDEPYWALSPSSPLAGAGRLFDWPDGATDLAGRERVRDGKVDVGCYQCWFDEPFGLLLIFR